MMKSQIENTYSLKAFKLSLASLAVFVLAVAVLEKNLESAFAFWLALIVSGVLSFCGTIYSLKSLKEKSAFGKWFSLILNSILLLVSIFFVVGNFYGMH